MPKASVIIPAYNAELVIRETLDSIANQTFKDFECIVIDDGSSDGTAQCVHALQDPRFRVISIKNSGGPARPRNIGLTNAKGDYIFIFDSDDIMFPEKIEKCVSALEKQPGANWLFSNFQTIDESGVLICDNFLREYDTLWAITGSSKQDLYLLPSEKIFNGILRVNFVGTSSVVLRKSALQASDRFDEGLKNSDDRVFWTKFSLGNNAVFVNDILHQYRVREGAISRQGFDKRAPSKIEGLLVIKGLCKTDIHRSVVNENIYNDYLSLAYFYREKRSRYSLIVLLKAARFGMDHRWFKAIIKSLFIR